ncbi:MAG: DMT family transporter [Ahrensia sp.]|nr:DMT family transporter [Ahrensia sp.]
MPPSPRRSPVPSPRMEAQDWALLVVLSLIWGASFLFARIAVLEVPPLMLVFWRVALAALALNLFVALSSRLRFGDRRLWLNFAGMGLLNNIIPFSLIFYGQQEIGAGLAAIVNAMTPIWTALIAHASTQDERLSGNKLIGIVLGFTGVAVLIGSAALQGLAASALAQLAVLGATLSYGVASVFGRRFKSVPPLQTARGQLTASTILMLPIPMIAGASAFALPSAQAIWSVVLLAIVCTALAYLLFFRILSRAGALNISLVTFLVPLSAIALGIVVLGETLHLRHLMGLAIILAGLVAIDGRLLKRKA